MEEGKDGRMEGWKDGRMEGWKDGRGEEWNEDYFINSVNMRVGKPRLYDPFLSTGLPLYLFKVHKVCAIEVSHEL